MAVTVFQQPMGPVQTPTSYICTALTRPVTCGSLVRSVPNHSVASLDVAVDEIFHRDVKFPPLNLFSGLLPDHLTGFPSKVIIVTDASTRNEKAGVGSFSHSLDCAFSR